MIRQHRLFYGSSYDRGLQHLLGMWSDIKKAYPDAELHICYGWNLFVKGYADNPERMAWKDKMDKLMEQDGITHHGRVSKEELKAIRQQCGIWAYPTHFGETNCHPAGTYIETMSGDTAIEKLTMSDLVRTKEGNYRRVTAVRSRKINEDICRVKMQNSEDLLMTKDHPVLAIKRKQEHKGKKLEDIVKDIPDWVDAGRLEKGDIVLSSRIISNGQFVIDVEPFRGYRKNNLPTEEYVSLDTNFNDTKALWFGYFVGDGHANNRGKVEVLVAKKHKDRDYDNVVAGFRDFGFEPSVREESGYYKIQTYSYMFARFLRSKFYDYDRNKILPNELVGNYQVFKGMMNSDGWVDYEYNNSNGIYCSYTSKSRKLISQMRTTLTILGFAPKIYTRVHKNKCVSYRVSWTDVENKKVNFYQKDDKFVYRRIKNVETEMLEGLVYNIDVEDEHTYHANGIIVHNCITALDASADGCVPVVINYAGLRETVGTGVRIEGDIYEESVREEYLKELLALMGDEKRWKEEQAKGVEWSKNFSWDIIAEAWCEHF